ncbi:hypothetical protein AAGS40_15050 [Paraburkholderia sp. PREW-6R]|uniref:hypothetical protein n=1 Tax=Paraburkholderia sp. PREW-6R TaxID=3141544 RepID=UPI0031F4912C
MLTPLLIFAALIDVAIALLHVYVIVKGPFAYRRFGAGEKIATMAEQGSPFPALLTSGITLAFVVFAAYYLAAAGWLPVPPYLLAGLAVIALVFVTRAVLIVPAALAGRKLTAFDRHTAAIAIAIGLIHGAAALLYASHVCGGAPASASAACQYMARATPPATAP